MNALKHKAKSLGKQYMALKRAVVLVKCSNNCLLAAGVLGHSLGALTDSMLGQLTREQQTHSGLDLAAGDGGALVVVGQSGGFGSDPLKDVVDKAVHDGHGLATDASVRVHLLQHLVDIDGIALLPFPLALLVPCTDSLGFSGLFGALGTDFGWHGCVTLSSGCRMNKKPNHFSFILRHLILAQL